MSCADACRGLHVSPHARRAPDLPLDASKWFVTSHVCRHGGAHSGAVVHNHFARTPPDVWHTAQSGAEAKQREPPLLCVWSKKQGHSLLSSDILVDGAVYQCRATCAIDSSRPCTSSWRGIKETSSAWLQHRSRSGFPQVSIRRTPVDGAFPRGCHQAPKLLVLPLPLSFVRRFRPPRLGATRVQVVVELLDGRCQRAFSRFASAVTVRHGLRSNLDCELA